MDRRFDASWVREILSALAARRPVFHSEADFQHAFAWQMQLAEPEASVRLETRPFGDRRVHLDVALVIDNVRIAIELKHLTRGLTVDVDGERFTLLNQAAHDIARYDVVKDVERVEQVVDAGLAERGYVIVLSNDQAYWRRGTKPDPVDLRFRLHEGARLAGVAAWSAVAGPGTTRGRERQIELTGEYAIAWDDYSRVAEGPAGRFRYLLIDVPSSDAVPRQDVGLTSAMTAAAVAKGVASADDQTARAQILEAFAVLEQRLARSEFALREIVDEVQRRGTSLAESTIRTFVSSVMCVDAPANHAVRYADLRRVERGRYARITDGSPDVRDRSRGEAAKEVPSDDRNGDMRGEVHDVEHEFDRAMIRVYERAKDEADYTATRFIQLVSDVGGLAAAHRLLQGQPSDGFTALWERGRLDLTVEALVLDDRFSELFSDHERDIARIRLAAYGFPA